MYYKIYYLMFGLYYKDFILFSNICLQIVSICNYIYMYEDIK